MQLNNKWIIIINEQYQIWIAEWEFIEGGALHCASFEKAQVEGIDDARDPHQKAEHNVDEHIEAETFL